MAVAVVALVTAVAPEAARAAGPVLLEDGTASTYAHLQGEDDDGAEGTGLSFTDSASVGSVVANMQMLTVDAPGGILITASGDVSSPNTDLPDPSPHSTRAAIILTRDFETSAPLPYDFSATWSKQGGPNTDATLTAYLTGPPDVFFHSRDAEHGTDADGSETFSESGTLPADSYTLQIVVACGGVSSAACTASLSDLEFEVGDGRGDADGDRLFDEWETDGIDFTGNGSVDLDLPAMGADPRHKDIFLELDHMAGHELSQVAINRVVTAFASAPVANPDGDPGVSLHVDNGPASPMKPGGQTWGALSDADTIAHQEVLGTFVPGSDDVYDWTAFDGLKAGNFSIDREVAFHYAISGHQFGAAANTSSGVSRGIGASDLLVTLGAFSAPDEGSGTVDEQAGTLMHELGHNLGLQHGGQNDTNYKPNYLSIMNYSFQMGGLRRADGTRVLDYSRFVIPLNESALDQSNGFGFAAGTGPAKFMTLIGCGNDPQLIGNAGTLFAVPLLAGPVNWDCDGTTVGQVASDVNGDHVLTAFTGFSDWPAIVYDGGAIGAGGAALPQTTEVIEPQRDELLVNEQALQAAPVTREPPPVTPSGPPVTTTSGPPLTTTSGPPVTKKKCKKHEKRASSAKKHCKSKKKKKSG